MGMLFLGGYALKAEASDLEYDEVRSEKTEMVDHAGEEYETIEYDPEVFENTNSNNPSIDNESQYLRSSEVVISATRTARDIFEVPSSVGYRSSKEMDREPKTTVAEQLQDIPGIQVYDQGVGGGAKRVTIRGEGAKRVLVLMDGMKISEQKSMDGSMILVDPNNIERIEVIKGPASVLYGSEAIGGVVNIITKKGGTKPVQASFSITGDGSNNSLTPFGAIYGNYNGFSYRFSSDFTHANNKRGGSGTIDRSNYNSRNHAAYLDYSTDNFKIGGGYDFYRADINVPKHKSYGSARGATGLTTIDLDIPEWRRERFYFLTELTQLSDYLQKLSFNAFTSYTEKDFRQKLHVDIAKTNPFGPKIDMFTDISTLNKQRSYGLNFQSDWLLGDHYIVAGVDYLRDNLKAYQTRGGGMIFSGPMNMDIPHASNGDYTDKGKQQSFAAFIQDEWSISSDWTATFGLRGTWVKSELTDTNTPNLETGSTSDNNLSFSAGLVYSGFENWRLRALYSQGYRYPLLQELYIGTPHGGSGVLLPNKDLDPEKSQSFELGARYDDGSWNADLAVYYTQSKDYIYQESIAGSDDQIFKNANKAKTMGSELILGYTIKDWNLTPYVQGAFIYRELEQKAYTTSLTGNPKWTGRTGLRYENELSPEFSWHADGFLRMAGSAKEKVSGSSSQGSASSGEVLHHPGWTTLNLALGAEFGKEKEYFVELNVNNILDKGYRPASSSLEDPGFHVVLKTGVEF